MNEDFPTTLAAARVGDRAAYDELFTRNLPALIAFLRAKVGGPLRERESVRDLAQSVCREVLRDLEGLDFRSEESFRSYLFLQGTRKVIDRFRYHTQERRDLAREQPLPLDEESAQVLGAYAGLASPSRTAGAKEELTRVEQAIQQLPEPQREVVLLSRIAGLSYAEIAHQKGTTESAVRGLVARGLARLAGLLDGAAGR